MKKAKNAIHALGDDGMSSHIATYYVNSQENGQNVIKVMMEESKKVGTVLKAGKTSNAFLVELPTNVVVDVFLSNYTDSLGDKSQVYMVSQNTKYLPSQNALDIIRIAHAPILQDKDATIKDAVLTHMPIINEEELTEDKNSFSFRVVNEGNGLGQIQTFYNSKSDENQLQPKEMMYEVIKRKFYCSPSYAFILTAQQAYEQLREKQNSEVHEAERGQ